MARLTTPRSLCPPSVAEIDDLRRKLDQLASEGHLQELIELVVTLLTQMREDNTALTVRLHKALRALYGRKSQKISTDQLALLFAELGDEPPAQAPTAAATASTPEPGEAAAPPTPPAPPKPPRGHGGRAPLPSHLPRRQRIIAVPQAERVCASCGADKTCIGYRTSEILEFVPAHFLVIEEKCEKLACATCPEQGVATAPSDKVMDRGRPGPGLLANILVKKYHDAMPLYRQTQEYARGGVSLSPSTLGDWSAFGLDVLAPVAERIFVHVRSFFLVNADDTGLRVLDRDHPQGVKRGHVWAFVGAGMVAFRYAPDWKAKRPAAMLQGFTGYLQGDGYAGYKAMLCDGQDGEQPLVPEDRRLGCGMHIRAKFESAVKTKDMRAAVALSYFKTIYRLEAQYKAEGLSPEARQQQREEQSLPVVDGLYRWIHDLHARLVPKTPLYEATLYAIHQEQAWRRCFTDGRFEIDNGEVERRIRRVALGRKNYLFAGSDKGAERLAVAYTVFGSCQMQGINPLAWATDVIAKLQDGFPLSRLDELLPHRWGKPASASDDKAAEAPG